MSVVSEVEERYVEALKHYFFKKDTSASTGGHTSSDIITSMREIVPPDDDSRRLYAVGSKGMSMLGSSTQHRKI